MALKPDNDQAKCEGLRCSYRESCGRYMRPAGDRQTWAAFYASKDDDCEAFEPIPLNGHGETSWRHAR